MVILRYKVRIKSARLHSIKHLKRQLKHDLCAGSKCKVVKSPSLKTKTISSQETLLSSDDLNVGLNPLKPPETDRMRIKRRAVHDSHSKTLFVVENTTVNYGYNISYRLNQSPLKSMAKKLIGRDFFKDVILPSSGCAGINVELVICVTSKRDNWRQRKTIRTTWGNFQKTSPGLIFKLLKKFKSNSMEGDGGGRNGKIVLLFFIGNSSQMNASAEQQAIEKESQKYGDIYQADHEDTYGNLTLKSMSMLRYISLYCVNARFVAKMDDDVYLNVPALLSALRTQEELAEAWLPETSFAGDGRRGRPLFVTGRMIFNGTVQRNKTHKWYIPREELDLPGNRYPNYLSGSAYAMPGPTALALYKASLNVPFFWIEDVYITALCANWANVTVIGDKRFLYNARNVTGCTMMKSIASNSHSFREIQKIHRELSNPFLDCSKSK